MRSLDALQLDVLAARRHERDVVQWCSYYDGIEP